jgi:hypothetical protein
MEGVKENNIFIEWFLWQFFEMPGFLLEVWKNYLMFASNIFSLPLLVKTFFAPWRKYNWRYPKGFDVVEFFNTLISNTFSRILGAMMRIVLIIVGILFQIFVVITGLVIFIGWLLTPIFAIAGILFVLLI